MRGAPAGGSGGGDGLRFFFDFFSLLGRFIGDVTVGLSLSRWALGGTISAATVTAAASPATTLFGLLAFFAAGSCRVAFVPGGGGFVGFFGVVFARLIRVVAAYNRVRAFGFAEGRFDVFGLDIAIGVGFGEGLVRDRRGLLGDLRVEV